MTAIQPTSFRFHPATLNLLDAWAVQASKVKGRNVTRVQIIEQLLAAHIPEPSDAKNVRDAFEAFEATL